MCGKLSSLAHNQADLASVTMYGGHNGTSFSDICLGKMGERRVSQSATVPLAKFRHVNNAAREDSARSLHLTVAIKRRPRHRLKFERCRGRMLTHLPVMEK